MNTVVYRYVHHQSTARIYGATKYATVVAFKSIPGIRVQVKSYSSTGPFLWIKPGL